MRHFDGSNIEAIKERLDIVELAEELTVLKAYGKTLKGCCPFHDEKTASFVVYPNNGKYVCFGCGVKGSAIDLYAHMHKIRFSEAIRILEREFGLVDEEQQQQKEKPWTRLSKKDFQNLGLKPVGLKELKDEDPVLYQTIVLGKIEEKLSTWSFLYERCPIVMTYEQVNYYQSLRDRLLKEIA